MNAGRLIKDGAVIAAGFTPTDVMHIKKDFGAYCAEASSLAAEIIAFNLGISAEELCDFVYGEVKRKLYVNIVKAALENKNEDCMKNGVSKDAEAFINECFREGAGGRGGLLSVKFESDFALVGIGAPVKIFLPDVAEMLGATAVIPEHFEVANALGAIIGSVAATAAVEIKPNTSAFGITGYTVHGPDGAKIFKDMKAASRFAAAEAERLARAEAVSRGAKGDISVTSSIDDDEAAAKNARIYLGTTVTARAVGSAGF